MAYQQAQVDFVLGVIHRLGPVPEFLSKQLNVVAGLRSWVYSPSSVSYPLTAIFAEEHECRKKYMA